MGVEVRRVDVRGLLNDRRMLPEIDLSTVGGEEAVASRKIKIDQDFKEKSVKGIQFKDCLFLKAQLSEITFTGCTFKDCRFFGCKFEHVEFHSCRFINCLFIKPRFEQTYLNPSSLEFDSCEWKKHAPNLNTYLFQKVEANSRDTHQADFASVAHIEFRRYQRWQTIRDLKKARDWWDKGRLALRVASDCAYDWTLVYGYGLFRAILVTVVVFYLALWWVDTNWKDVIGATTPLPAMDQANSLQKMYFLAVTATTLGFGDTSTRTEVGMLFVITVAVISVIWTATLTALIVKRLVK